jgi:hypothetical protein
MSFGFGVGDIMVVCQLAWKVVVNCRKACGEYDVLTKHAASLHAVLGRLKDEASKPESLLNRNDDERGEDLKKSIEECNKILRVLDNVLEKYNALSEDKRAGRRLWKKVMFGNREVLYLSDLRDKISTYTDVINLQLMLVSMGSQGRVERGISEISHAVPEFRVSLHWIIAKLSGGNEGSVLTSYSGDEESVWRELRRELVLEGFTSPHIRQHKAIIMSYIKELGDRGLLDDPEQPDTLGNETILEVSSGHEPGDAFDVTENIIGIEQSPGERRKEHSDSSDTDSPLEGFLDQPQYISDGDTIELPVRKRQTPVAESQLAKEQVSATSKYYEPEDVLAGASSSSRRNDQDPVLSARSLNPGNRLVEV